MRPIRQILANSKSNILYRYYKDRVIMKVKIDHMFPMQFQAIYFLVLGTPEEKKSKIAEQQKKRKGSFLLAPPGALIANPSHFLRSHQSSRTIHYRYKQPWTLFQLLHHYIRQPLNSDPPCRLPHVVKLLLNFGTTLRQVKQTSGQLWNKFEITLRQQP